MAEVDEMIDEIKDIANGRIIVPFSHYWPHSIEDIAYIGDKKSPYDEGEHYKRVLILLRRDIQPDDLRRFHCVERILIIDTLIDQRLSLDHFDMAEELRLLDVRFGDTLPEFGSIRKIIVNSGNLDEDDPDKRTFFQRLLASTSKSEMEMGVTLNGFSGQNAEGWLGRQLHLVVYSDSPDDSVFRLSNCSNLGLFSFNGFFQRGVTTIISNLPRLEILRSNCVKHLEIEDRMDSLNYLRLDREKEKDGTIVGLENCESLYLLELRGYHLIDLRTVSQNSSMKSIDLTFGSLSSLVGLEFLHRLEYLTVRKTPLAREFYRALRRIEEGKSGGEDSLRSLLAPQDSVKANITTGMGWVDKKLKEFASHTSS